MSDTKQLINSLDQKVDQLLAKLKQEGEATLKKDEEIRGLKSKISEQSEALEQLKIELESKNKIEVSSDAEDTGAAKQKIDELVNEIDKCISLIKV